MSLESLSLLDYIIIIIISASVIFSFIKGFVQSLLGLLTWIGAVILTLIFYENLSNFVISYINRISFLEETGISKILSIILSIPFIFLISLILLKKIKSLISTNFQKSSLGNLFDKIFGSIYGFIFGLILVSLSIITINNLFIGFASSKFVENSILYPYLNDFNIKYVIKYTPLILEETNTIIIENSNS